MYIHKEKSFTAHTRLELSPFFERTSHLNLSQEWRRWGGHLSATQYDLNHENEYFAIRTKAALFDISPLYKYNIKGKDAQIFLDQLVTRNILKCKIGQVMYTPWCDEYGKVIDILNTAACDIIIIDYENKEIMVPAVDQYVALFDFENKLIKVNNIRSFIEL